MNDIDYGAVFGVEDPDTTTIAEGAEVTEPAEPSAESEPTDHRDRERPLLDEQSSDQTPRDERRDIGHDHPGQERAELLDRYSGTRRLAGGRRFGTHNWSPSSGRRGSSRWSANELVLPIRVVPEGLSMVRTARPNPFGDGPRR